MTRRSLAVVVALLLFAPAAIRGKAQPVPIFVTSAGAVNGLTDPSADNQSSVADLREAIKAKKTLALVETKEAATIVLTVQGRSMETRHGLYTVDYATLHLAMTYQGHDSNLTASEGNGMTKGRWRKAADNIVGQVETWVKANIK
jgi:hypothetical protein